MIKFNKIYEQNKVNHIGKRRQCRKLASMFELFYFMMSQYVFHLLFVGRR